MQKKFGAAGGHVRTAGMIRGDAMADNPRHRVLVIGVGSIGERHLRCFQQTGRCQLSFVEINDAAGDNQSAVRRARICQPR